MKSFKSIDFFENKNNSCFCLVGFDFVIQSNLEPWLFSITSNPSMTETSVDDYKFKYGLIDDVFHILNLEELYFIKLL